MKKALEAKYVELFGNESVYEYYRLKVLITLEEVNISVVEKKQNLYEKNFNDEANPSGVVNFHSMQMSFAISMHACILSVMIGMTRHVHHFLALWQWCNFELRPLIFVYFSRVLNQSRNKSSNIYDIKSKYPEEYSTVDKVGREKLVGRKSCFV